MHRIFGLLALLLLAVAAGAGEPASLIENGDFSEGLSGWILGDRKHLSAEVVRGDAPDLSRAVRLKTDPPPGGPPWSVAIGRRCSGGARRGDVISMSAWLRSPDGCPVDFVFELARAPYTKDISRRVVPGRDWREYRFSGRAHRTYRAGEAQVKLFLGRAKGTVEIAGIRVENSGEPPPDDAWRAAAEKRIERIRKGDLEIRVVDPEGRPVPGASVRVDQRRHHFRFGTAVPAARIVDSSNPDNRRFKRTVERLFNTVTFENDLKWAAARPGRLETVMKAVDWLSARDIEIRGHCLLWGSYRHLHRSARGLRKEALARAMEEHVKAYARAARGKLYVWDVVNEAANNVEVWEEVGWERFAEAFRWAREADPDVRLAYNDFGILGRGGGHRKRVAERIRFLLDREAPLDVLGLQAHMGLPLTPMAAVLATLDRWAEFGKDLEITEFDLSLLDDEVHGAWCRDFLIAVFSHPQVTAFVMWGFWEGSHWRGKQGGAMFRRDWTPRPAAVAYADLVLRRWWTRFRGETDEAGAVRLRAFYGRHEVRAAAGGREGSAVVDLRPGAAGEVELTVK